MRIRGSLLLNAGRRPLIQSRKTAGSLDKRISGWQDCRIASKPTWQPAGLIVGMAAFSPEDQLAIMMDGTREGLHHGGLALRQEGKPDRRTAYKQACLPTLLQG